MSILNATDEPQREDQAAQKPPGAGGKKSETPKDDPGSAPESGDKLPE